MGHKLTAASASTLAAGMALALLAVVWSALRAGSNTALFRLGLEEQGEAAGGAAQPLVGDDEEGRAFVQARRSARWTAQNAVWLGGTWACSRQAARASRVSHMCRVLHVCR